MASRGVNKVILVGNLGQDPEVRYMTNGNVVTNITLATSESWFDKQSGEKKEKTEWHRVVLFGKLAEVAGEYLRKGSQVYIEGTLQTRKWQDQSGQDRYTTEVVVNVGGIMQMLGGRQGGGAGASSSESISSINHGGNATAPTFDSGQLFNDNKPSRLDSDIKPKRPQEPIATFDDEIPF